MIIATLIRCWKTFSRKSSYFLLVVMMPFGGFASRNSFGKFLPVLFYKSRSSEGHDDRCIQ